MLSKKSEIPANNRAGTVEALRRAADLAHLRRTRRADELRFRRRTQGGRGDRARSPSKSRRPNARQANATADGRIPGENPARTHRAGSCGVRRRLARQARTDGNATRRHGAARISSRRLKFRMLQQSDADVCSDSWRQPALVRAQRPSSSCLITSSSFCRPSLAYRAPDHRYSKVGSGCHRRSKAGSGRRRHQSSPLPR